MLDVALDVPRALVAIGRLAQRHYAGFTRTEMLGNPLDDAVLAGCVSTFEENENLKIIVDQMPLQLDQLHLQFP